MSRMQGAWSWAQRLTARQRGLDPQAVDDFFRSLRIHIEPGRLHGSVLARMNEIAGCSRSSLLLMDPGRGDLCVQAETGDWPESFRGSRWPCDEGLIRWLAINTRPLVTRIDAGAVASLPEAQQRLLAEAAVETAAPLAAAGRVIGLIALGETRHRGGWTRQLAHSIATLAVPAALAFEHAALIAEEKDRLRRLYRAERLATAGTLATGLAHEIRNPLTSIRSGMQLIRDRPGTPPDAIEILGEVIAEVDRIDRLVNGLLMFARAPRSDLHDTDLNEVARRSAALLASRARSGGVEIALTLPATPTIVHGDAGQLEQVVLNLLLNALDAVTGQEQEPPAGPVELVLEQGQPATVGPALAELEVRDRGCGLPEGAGERVLDPFFTTKADGTGLGLAISYNIVARHGGELTLEDRASGGAIARMVLPIAGTG